MFQYLGVYQGFKGSVLTNSSRGIHNAWHFYYALVLVFKAVCSSIGIALFTP
ncbi:DUF3265 domain-containing protein [Vibrio parahaemolyticus]|nr:DUF3265 domain-containing protein [Vibrio parahaemolyticus]EHD2278994.1 DUF3265 domain-containing protein [Vibrio parahaemolyticus]EHH2498548.1 DUF3265 domain-containing protein [Vibrio parahaemolyticus]